MVEFISLSPFEVYCKYFTRKKLEGFLVKPGEIKSRNERV